METPPLVSSTSHVAAPSSIAAVMAASSSRIEPEVDRRRRPPRATRASSVRRLESRICPGPRGRPGGDELVARRQHADPRPREGTHLGGADAGEHAEVARASAPRRRRRRRRRRGGRRPPGARGGRARPRRGSPRTRRRRAARCARPSRPRRRRRASAPRSRSASPRRAARAAVGRVAGGDLRDDREAHGTGRARARRVAPPARRTRPWPCWRTAARPPARRRPRPARGRPRRRLRPTRRQRRARARARGRCASSSGISGTDQPMPCPRRSRPATRGTRGRGRRGRGRARRWPAGSRACCRCRSGPRRTCSRSTSWSASSSSMASVSWISPPAPGFDLLEGLEDPGREDVAADHRPGRGRLLGLRLLDHAGDPAAGGRPAGSRTTQPYALISSGGNSLHAITEAPVRSCVAIISDSTVECSSMMSSPSITANGSSPTCLRATDTAWPRPSGSPWRT